MRQSLGLVSETLRRAEDGHEDYVWSDASASDALQEPTDDAPYEDGNLFQVSHEAILQAPRSSWK